MISKEIRNNNGTIDKIIATSYDDYEMSISNEYKLVKIAGRKGTFKDTLLGSDIGIHSKGFINVAIFSMLISVSVIIFMYLSFRV